MNPALIIITGHPGTGKTTLAHRLSDELKLPVVCKDEVKEILFDRLGWDDKEWSQKLSLASYSIMDYMIENTLNAGSGLIIESNFIAEYDSERMRKFIQKFGARAVQILLYCNENVRSDRFMNRISSGNRHPGHHARDKAQEHLERSKRIPLALDIPLIEIDTTDCNAIDYGSLLMSIRETCLDAGSTV